MSFHIRANRDTMTSMLSCVTDQTIQTEGDVEPFLLEKKYPTVLTNNEGFQNPTIPEDQSYHLEHEEHRNPEREYATGILREDPEQEYHHSRLTSESSIGCSEAEKVLVDRLVPDGIQNAQAMVNKGFDGSQYEGQPLQMPQGLQRRGRNMFPPSARTATAPVRPLPDPKVYKRQQQRLKKQRSAPNFKKSSPRLSNKARVLHVPRVTPRSKVTGEVAYEMYDEHGYYGPSQHLHNYRKPISPVETPNIEGTQGYGSSGYPERGGDWHIPRSAADNSAEHPLKAYANIDSSKAQRCAPGPNGRCSKYPDSSIQGHDVRTHGSCYNHGVQRWTPGSYEGIPKSPYNHGLFDNVSHGDAPNRPLPPTPSLTYQDEEFLNSSRILTDAQESETNEGSFEYAGMGDERFGRRFHNGTRYSRGYAAEVDTVGFGKRVINPAYSKNGGRGNPIYNDEFDVRGICTSDDNYDYPPNGGRLARGVQTEEFDLEGVRGIQKQQSYQQMTTNIGGNEQAQHHNRLVDERIQAFDQNILKREEYFQKSNRGCGEDIFYPHMPVSQAMKNLKKQVTAPEHSLRNTYRDSGDKYLLARNNHASKFLINPGTSKKLSESDTVAHLAHIETQNGAQGRRNASASTKMQDHATFPAPIFDKQGNWISHNGDPISNKEGLIVKSQNVPMETAGAGLRLMSDIRTHVERATEMTKKFQDLSDFKLFWKFSYPGFVQELRIMIGEVMSFSQNLRSPDSDFGRKLFQGVEESGTIRISVAYDGVSIFICVIITLLTSQDTIFYVGNDGRVETSRETQPRKPYTSEKSDTRYYL